MEVLKERVSRTTTDQDSTLRELDSRLLAAQRERDSALAKHVLAAGELETLRSESADVRQQVGKACTCGHTGRLRVGCDSCAVRCAFAFDDAVGGIAFCSCLDC